MTIITYLKRITARRDVKLLLELFLGYLDEGAAQEPRTIKLIDNIAGKLIQRHRGMRDAGGWNAETPYGPGATVSHNGAARVAQVESKAVKPGDAPAGVCASKAMWLP